MPLLDKLLGPPVHRKAKKRLELSILAGVGALGLDALASTAYGPEAALMILSPLGISGEHYFTGISLLVVLLLFTLYLSYRQTAAAYPKGGGAYSVARDTMGKRVGVWAAIALLLDYLLNVAVGISAGVGAIVSAIPALHHHMLSLCLSILLLLTLLNLRGIRDTGITFVIPTVFFVVFLSIALSLGLYEIWQTGGHPIPLIAPPTASPPSANLSLWLLLAAFANGLTAMTGVEAVSNAVPLFREPKVRNAQWTLTIIVGILGIFLIAIGFICPAYHVVAMDENLPGYQTILSQIVAAIMGKGVFYYIAITAIFIVLTYSAQTSFADFPRVCHFLADDDYLPHFLSEQSRRLVFSLGIIMLGLFSAVLLIVFKGITNNLIPLFAIDAFSAFLFSQTGMVIHWLRQAPDIPYVKLFINAFGACATAIALIIIIATKFMEGAWIIFLIAPLLGLLMHGIRRHYRRTAREIATPIEIATADLTPPITIIPIHGLDRVSVKAIQYAMHMSQEIYVVFVDTGNRDVVKLKKLWLEKIDVPARNAKLIVPKLAIIGSPYGRIFKPILHYVRQIKSANPGRLFAVIIPELIEPYWYENLLHNVRSRGLKAVLFMERDYCTAIITIPWFLREGIKYP